VVLEPVGNVPRRGRVIGRRRLAESIVEPDAHFDRDEAGGRRGAVVKPYLAAAGVTGACTGISFLLFPHVELSDVIMIYLIGVVAVSTRFGLWPSVATAAMSVLACDFFFVPPYLAFVMQDLKYLVTIAFMFVVAVIIGGLTDRVRVQGELARLREQRMTVLYAISRDLSAVREPAELCEAARRHVDNLFDCRVVFFLKGAGKLLGMPVLGGFEPDARQKDAARWVWAHGTPAGLGEAEHGNVGALCLPLPGSRGSVGVICIRPYRHSPFRESEQRNLLETIIRLIATALESALFAKDAELAQLQFETERLRSGLLSSVSHDLRTPLATIEGAATTMLQEDAPLTESARTELTQAIVDESHRLGRLVRNLLDMTRLESKEIRPDKEWQDIEEVVGGALTRVEARLKGRIVATRIGESLPLVPMDTVLIEQVLINLLENADRHTPAGTPIEISAVVSDGELVVAILDRGPGLIAGTEAQVFEKFFRRTDSRGAGLGLAIGRSIVLAHGGRIWAENRTEGGARFLFALPLGEHQDDEAPPPMGST
jgi:two-component system sensor histidine kinase KdpD